MSLRNDLSDIVKLLTFRKLSGEIGKLSVFSAAAYLTYMAAASVYIDWLAMTSQSRFEASGLNSVIAETCIGFLLVAAFARSDASGATLRLLILAAAGVDVLDCAVMTFLRFMAPPQDEEVRSLAVTLLIVAAAFAPLLWFVAVTRSIFKRLDFVRWPGLRAVGFTLCSILAVFAVPRQPLFPSADDAPGFHSFWDIGRAIARARGADDGEQAERWAKWRQRERANTRLETMQPGRLAAEAARLAPRAPDRANVFVIGVSGWSEQAVFERETRRSLEILAEHFHAEGHVAALINDESAHADHPLASVQNLAALVREVAGRMDRDQDALILTLTSHGSRDGFALSDGDLVHETLDPAALKAILDEAGIKNRILIVSACHSGVFVPELASPDTLILTAASAERSSFGCANDREWTYFGDAFFAHGLKERATLTEAFVQARAVIQQWEQAETLTPSEPQIFVGEAIAARFPDLVGKPPVDSGSAPPPPLSDPAKRATL